MGVQPSQPDTRFWLDHHDVSGFLNAGSIGWDAEILESGNFATSGLTETASGKYTEKASETILFDATGGAASIDALIDSYAKLDTAHYRGRTFGSHAEGHSAYETIEVLESKPLTAAEGAILMMNAAWKQAGPTARSKILRNATVTGTDSGTGRNQGATLATQTYQAMVRVLGGTFTSITVQLQASVDDVDGHYALVTGMTHTFSAVGSFRLTFTGVTAAWKRARVSAFVGSNAIIVVTGGVVHDGT